MKKGILLLLAFVAFSGLNEATAQSKDWKRVYTSDGRSAEIPDWWESQESVSNGVKQLLAINTKGNTYMAIFYFEGQASAGDRMQAMISHNNIDIIDSNTETFGSLRVLTKKGKMKYNGKLYKVLISTADGAGEKMNIVGAMWGPEEAFQKHKDKFEKFFTSALQ